MADMIQTLEAAAEQKYGLPAGVLSSIRQQETGGQQAYLDDPTKAHYPTGYTKDGVKSSAFGPYGILESTAKQPGYGTAPLADKSLSAQVDFAASYLTGRANKAGSLEAGLAGYGEGSKYATQVLNRLGGSTMATTPAPAPATSNIDAMAASNMARNDVTANALESFQQQIQGVMRSAQDMLSSMGTNAETVKVTEQMATADAQAKSAGIAAALGTDPSQSGYMMDKVAEQFTKAYDRNQSFADKLAHATDLTNIYKDPLNWLGNALLFDVNVLGEQATRRQADSAQSRYLALNQMTQQGAQTQNAIKQSVTTETAKMAGELARQEIDFKAVQLQMESIRTASDATVKVAQLRNDNMNIALRQRDQQLQEQQIAASRLNAQTQSASLALALEERQERLNLKKEEAEAREGMLQNINLGRKLNGDLPPFKTFSELQTAIKMDKQLADSVSSQYQAGLVASQTGQATIANSPYEALKYVASTGAVITDGRARVISFLDGQRTSIVNDPKLVGTIKKPADLAKVLDANSQNTASAMLRNIAAGGDKNLYAPPTLAVLNADPALAETYLVQKILAPYQALGNKDINFKYATNALLKAVAAKEITMQQADSELGFLAEKIKGYNNAQMRYKATAGLPDMASVNVPLDDNSAVSSAVNRMQPIRTGFNLLDGTTGAITNVVQTVLGGTDETIVDLADPNKRSAYLNKRMAQQLPLVLRQQSATQTKIGGQQ